MSFSTARGRISSNMTVDDSKPQPRNLSNPVIINSPGQVKRASLLPTTANNKGFKIPNTHTFEGIGKVILIDKLTVDMYVTANVYTVLDVSHIH